MAIFKRGRYYHYDFELNGHRYYGSTKRTSKQKAENALAVLRMQILDGVQGVPNSKAVPSFSKFADQFLEWAKVNLEKSTVKLHRVNLADLKRFFRGKLLTEIDTGDVEEFKVWRSRQLRKNGKDRLVTPATVNRALTTIKRIYSYADGLGINLRNPVHHVKFLKESPGRMRVLTIEEIEKYLAVSKGDLRDFAILASETGGRPEEILSLHQADLHFEGPFVSLPGTKTVGARRDVPLTEAAREVLRRRSESSPNGYIFPVRRPKIKNKEVGHIKSLKKAHERIIKKYFAEAPFVPYALRHTFATRCVQAGVDLPNLAALLGHTDVTMTMKYVHVQKEQKIAAVDKLQKYVALAKKFKESQEEEQEMDFAEIIEKGDRTLDYDDLGNPVRPRVPQNPQQLSEAEAERLMQDLDF